MRRALCRGTNDPQHCLIDNGGPLGMIAAVKRATIRNLIRLGRDGFLVEAMAALTLQWSMISSENRFPLFRIMLEARKRRLRSVAAQP
jgi:hypothetical protein